MVNFIEIDVNEKKVLFSVRKLSAENKRELIWCVRTGKVSDNLKVKLGQGEKRSCF